jgi:hypothetical protein
LPQADCVLARADAIELLELVLRNILHRFTAVSDVGGNGCSGAPEAKISRRERTWLGK